MVRSIAVGDTKLLDTKIRASDRVADRCADEWGFGCIGNGVGHSLVDR